MMQMACVGNCTYCKGTKFERCGAYFSHIWLQSIICLPRRKTYTSFITLGNDNFGAWDILTDSSYLGLPHTKMNAHLAKSVQIFQLISGFRPFLWKMFKFCRHFFTLFVAFMGFKMTVSISRFQYRNRFEKQTNLAKDPLQGEGYLAGQSRQIISYLAGQCVII